MRMYSLLSAHAENQPFKARAGRSFMSIRRKPRRVAGIGTRRCDRVHGAFGIIEDHDGGLGIEVGFCRLYALDPFHGLAHSERTRGAGHIFDGKLGRLFRGLSRAHSKSHQGCKHDQLFHSAFRICRLTTRESQCDASEDADGKVAYRAQPLASASTVKPR